MPSPLFSRYSQGENRVTASILAVFERISFALVERILQILCEESNLPLVEIRNQIKSKRDCGVPDGAIQASFSYLIETKVVQSTVDPDQLKRHLKTLESSSFAKKRLIVLTPDHEEPQVVKELKSDSTLWASFKDLKSDSIVWASFNDLYAAIAEITATDESWLSSDFSPPSEQECFLLRELVQMLFAERLVNTGKSDAVLIVPARSAIADYQDFSVYVCQPYRSFQRVEYIGFYHSGVIDKHIAKILRNPPIEAILLNEEGIDNPPPGAELTPEDREDLTKLVAQLRNSNSPRYGTEQKVFFLSSPGSQDTIKLAQDIKNDLRNATGRPYAFTQGQRYVPLSALKKNPATTTELLKKEGA
jgi:hypothetical protein